MATPATGDFPGDDRTLAVRLSAADFRRRFRAQEFDVPPGWVLLVYRGGEFVPPLYKPGRHQWPTSFWGSLGGLFGAGSDMSGWLVRTAPVSTGSIPINGLLASDGLPFVATLAVTAQALDALRVVTGLDPSRDAVTAADIEAMVAPHAEATLDAEVRGLSSQQLANAARREPLERAVLEAVRPPLQERGLMVVGMAQPLRLKCPRRDEGQRIREEYEALTSREQARAEGKRALDELLRSQEADEIRQAARQADQQEAKARTFQRVQAMLVQMERDRALTEEELSRIRRDADRARLLSDADWGRFVDDLEVAKAKGEYQMHVAIEVARAEAEYALKEVHLRLDEREQELLRQRRAADLRARAEQARLEEQITTARLEERERQKTIAAMEEARRQAAAQQTQQERTLEQRGVVRIENEDNETTEIAEPVGLLEVTNSDNLVIRLRGYVEQIRVDKSDNIRIIAEKGYGNLQKHDSDNVDIRAPSPQELEAEARRKREEASALDAELRRQEEAREAAHRRSQALEDQRADLDRRRLQALHDLEIEQQRARQEDDRRDRLADADARRRAEEFRKLVEIIAQYVPEGAGPDRAMLTIMPAVLQYPEHKDALLRMVEFLYARHLSEGKLALLRGDTQGFVAWTREHYGALGNTLDREKDHIRSVADLLAVIDSFLANPTVQRPPGGRPPAPPAVDWQDVFARAQPSVLLLHTPSGFGTGFVVEAGGQPVIVTAAHLFGEIRDRNGTWRRGPECEAGVAYVGGRTAPFQAVAWLNTFDLALLRPLSPLAAPPLRLADAPAHTGENIGVVGFPLSFEQPLRGSVARFSPGAVAGEWDRPPFHFRLTHLTASVTHGNSGGPVLNGWGHVVGVLEGGLQQAQGMNFAIPLSALAEVLVPRYPVETSWTYARVPGSILALYPEHGGWTVKPSLHARGVWTLAHPVGVRAEAVAADGNDLDAVIKQGLAALGHDLTDIRGGRLAVQPYWQEAFLKLHGSGLIGFARYDPTLRRGLVAVARRTKVPAPKGWLRCARTMACYLYPE